MRYLIRVGSTGYLAETIRYSSTDHAEALNVVEAVEASEGEWQPMSTLYRSRNTQYPKATFRGTFVVLELPKPFAEEKPA